MRRFSMLAVCVATASISARSCETSSDGALVGVERLLERLARLDVEVVRGLVEHEQVGAAGDERREREPPPLAAREHADLAVDLLLR